MIYAVVDTNVLVAAKSYKPESSNGHRGYKVGI